MSEKAESSGHIVALVTARDPEEAQQIAAALVRDRLAACVNIIPGVESFFWWDDKPTAGRESLLVIKTKKSLFPELARAVKKIHSYTLPEIIALPITSGSSEYLEWIDRETV